MMSKILAIDPGTTKCGYAVMEGDKILERGTVSSEATDNMKRCSVITCQLFYIMEYHKPDKIICEYPHKNGPGMKSKRITILFHLCGMIHGLANHLSFDIEFEEPINWKGNQPKSAHHPKLIRKAEEKYGVNISDDGEDTIDAVGLGMWYSKEIS